MPTSGDARRPARNLERSLLRAALYTIAAAAFLGEATRPEAANPHIRSLVGTVAIAALALGARREPA